MDHVAIMNPKLKLINKILSGEKKIESRWLKNKSAPWGKVKAGDRVYFKDSGGPVRVAAEVEKVMQFEKTDFGEAKKLFKDADSWSKGKNYCVLVFLRRPEQVKPFGINKFGFGSAAAWLCVEDINSIKVPQSRSL